MKLSDFVMLDTDEKKLAVLHLGVLIGKRKQQSSIAFLFQLEHFYVETWFNCDDHAIREYRIFDHTRSLTPYLDQIRIDDLMN